MFSTKTVSNVFQTCLKCFKLKKLVVEQKMAQPVEPDEEPIDPQLNRSRSGSTPNSTGRGPGRPPAQQVEGVKNSLSSKTVVQQIKVEPQPVKVQRSLAKH